MAKFTVSKTNVQGFVNACAFARHVYEDYRSLFEPHFEVVGVSKDILSTVAPHFTGNLNRALIEYLPILVCRLTDRGNRKQAVPFFAANCSFSNQQITEHFKLLSQRLLDFRKLVEPARNKFGAHLDRQAHESGRALGGASIDLWDQFWLDLQAFAAVLSEHFLARKVLICAGGGSDAPNLLSAVQDGYWLRNELDKGIRSLDAGKGAPLDIEKFIEEQNARHAGE
jgi:hypothetical protein